MIAMLLERIKKRRAKPRNTTCNPKRISLGEHLEPRTVLSSIGFLDGDAAYMTMSFAPDGTLVSGQSSSLFEMMSHLGTPTQWQAAIAAAFQEWSMHTNADVGTVDDDGSPFGITPPPSGNSQLGVIRIAAVPLAPETLAISLPSNSFITGSWVGDVIFNSEAIFDSVEELFAVALHEAGHVFGLEHNDRPLSPMHLHGPSPVDSLSDEDIAALQELYGARASDINEPNDDFGDATRLRVVSLPRQVEGSAPAITHGDLTSAQDVDVFAVEVPNDYAGAMTIQLRTSGLSSVKAEIAVYDKNRRLLATDAFNPESRDPSVTFNAGSNRELFVVVRSNDIGAQAIGGYALIATADYLNLVERTVVAEVTDGRYRFVKPEMIRDFFQDGKDPLGDDNLGAGDTLDDPIELTTTAGFVENRRFDFHGSLINDGDVTFYSFKTPRENLTSTRVSLALFEPGEMTPLVSLFDSHQNVVPAAILANGGGQLVLQIQNLEPQTRYYLKVYGRDLVVLHSANHYRGTISFVNTLVLLEAFTQGSLSTEASTSQHTLYVADPQIFHFLIGASSTSAQDSLGIEMSVSDSSGVQVMAIQALLGESRSRNGILLQPGTYSIRMSLISLDDQIDLIAKVDYRLTGTVVSDPFGVLPIDPIGDSLFRCEFDARFCYPGPLVSEDSFLLDPNQILVMNGPIRRDSREDVLADWWNWIQQPGRMNSPPQGTADRFSTQFNQSLHVDVSQGLLQNDADADQDELSALAVVAPVHGTLSLNSDGSFHYTPDIDFVGKDQFQYVVSDGDESSGYVDVLIFVEPTPEVVYGDSNNDAVFDSADLVTVFQFGEYEDEAKGNSTWETGDWNGDGEFDTADLVLAFQQGRYVTHAVST